MTRSEFIRAYAVASGLPAEYADIGFIDVDEKVLLALPCACGDPGCQGWGMVGADNALDHLELYAPEPLRSAYRAAVAAAGGK
jgi:hypothetical protein